MSDDEEDHLIEVQNNGDNSDNEGEQRNRSIKQDPIFGGTLSGNDAVFLGLEERLYFSFSASRVSDLALSARKKVEGTSSEKQLLNTISNNQNPRNSVDNLV